MLDLTTSCYLKAGFQAGTGAGKSFTALMLALGISKVMHNSAPVYVWDSEPQWHLYKPIFTLEGVDLIHRPNRSFKSLHNSLSEARRSGACVHIVDQISVPWRDLLDSFADDSGHIGMGRQNQLRGLWDEFVLEWKDLPIHSIVNGRLGWEFEDYEDEEGHRKFAKGDTKMRAGGSESFGYEPMLTCEFNRKQEVEHEEGKRRKRMRYTATVIKDQTSVLTDQQFTFVAKRLANYRQGDFRMVFREFQPHLDFITQCVQASMPRENSRDLVKTESYWQKHDKERKSLLEDWDATMDKLAAGRSKEAETIRTHLFEAITKVRSRTRFENFELSEIERCVLELMAVEDLVADGGKYALTADGQAIKQLVLLAQANACSVDGKKSIMQIQLEQSLEHLRGATA